MSYSLGGDGSQFSRCLGSRCSTPHQVLSELNCVNCGALHGRIWTVLNKKSFAVHLEKKKLLFLKKVQYPTLCETESEQQKKYESLKLCTVWIKLPITAEISYFLWQMNLFTQLLSSEITKLCFLRNKYKIHKKINTMDPVFCSNNRNGPSETLDHFLMRLEDEFGLRLPHDGWMRLTGWWPKKQKNERQRWPGERERNAKKQKDSANHLDSCWRGSLITRQCAEFNKQLTPFPGLIY